MDIQGKAYFSQPWFETKVKARYDEKFIYFGAYLQETSIFGTLTQRNSVVYHDNDFEIFIDVNGTTHNYKEFEVNVLNTTWNLLLNKPYRDNGHENSTRVDPKYGFDMFPHGMKSAVYVKGNPNDPSQSLHYWTVEIALPIAQLGKPKDHWRVNFSRVQWLSRVRDKKYQKIPNLAEENWVWSPQYEINMHRPEWWGYFQFFESDTTDSTLDPQWSVRYVAFSYYYAQQKYKRQHQVYSRSLQQLKRYFQDQNAFQCLHQQQLNVSTDGEYFTSQIQCKHSPWVAKIRQDGYILVSTLSSTSAASTAPATPESAATT